MIVQVDAAPGPGLCEDELDERGYRITTPSGYEFWLPQEVFERCFVELGGPLQEAVNEAMKQLAANPERAPALIGRRGDG
jgi:hypothetical protein